MDLPDEIHPQHAATDEIVTPELPDKPNLIVEKENLPEYQPQIVNLTHLQNYPVEGLVKNILQEKNVKATLIDCKSLPKCMWNHHGRLQGPLKHLAVL
jgi:hypothetical protein